MQHAVHYLETGSRDPYYNLAFEEYVLTHRTRGDYLLLWQNDNTIVVGQNQNTEAEINRPFVEAHHIHVVRRSTGGGAVYHDLGNLNYSFITDAGDRAALSMARFTQPVVEALQGLGLQAEASGRNDILVEGRKVSGTAQRLWGDRILHHGTLLFDANADMVAGALQVDPEKFRSKSTKSVRSRIGNIRESLPRDMTLQEFWQRLLTELAGDGLVREALTGAELAEIRALADEKYRSWAWTWGRFPQYGFRNRLRFPGGTLGVSLDVESGVIRDAVFTGDFMARTDSTPAAEALRGVRFEREAVRAALAPLDLDAMFGGIAPDEILEVLFG